MTQEIVYLITAITAMATAIGIVYNDFKKTVRENTKTLITFFREMTAQYQEAIANNTAALNKLEINDALDMKAMIDMGDAMKEMTRALHDIHLDLKGRKV